MKADLIEQINKLLPEFEERELYIQTPQGMHKVEHFKAIAEKAKTQPVAIVTRYYKLIQLREAFLKLIENLPEGISGRIYYWRGGAEMDIFPEGETVGVMVKNSVDGKVALQSSFIATTNGYSIPLPRTVLKGFRRIHKGNILLEYEAFTKTLGEIKQVWTTIVNKMSKVTVDEAKFLELVEVLKAGKRLKKRMESIPLGIDLWSYFVELIKAIASRTYKSEIHRRRKLAQISKVILNYAFFLEIQ